MSPFFFFSLISGRSSVSLPLRWAPFPPDDLLRPAALYLGGGLMIVCGFVVTSLEFRIGFQCHGYVHTLISRVLFITRLLTWLIQ